MKKIKIKKPEYLLSPLRLTMGILITWLIGIVLGVGLTVLVTRFMNYGQNVQYGIIIAGFILACFLVAVLISFLVTYGGMKLITHINENLTKISKGDYTAKLSLQTKSPQINSVVNKFNEMVDELNSVVVLKNDFISGFSHEFKTPIVSLKGYAELLADADNLTEDQKEYARIILEESERLSRLSENSLMLAKLDSQTKIVEKKSFSLDGQIEDCVLLLDGALKEKNIDVIMDLKRVRYKSDPYLIKEVWINLLSNAIKYSNDGGKINIKLRKQNGEIIVEIKDDGVGMASEVKERIFDKFYQADLLHSSKGLGLGLTIVKRILELTDGVIECQSEEGIGTTMTVKLKAK
ncbi:MAG: HAMP domain-containing histidine kinase [Clostridia bacterium]|nr:HAMP domain-containing histidine kinase [Clostridia bacterium]